MRGELTIKVDATFGASASVGDVMVLPFQGVAVLEGSLFSGEVTLDVVGLLWWWTVEGPQSHPSLAAP